MSGASGRTIGICVLFCLVLGVVVASLDEPLRIYAERAFNRRVVGYTLAIGNLDFHPIGLSVDFENVRLTQNEHPESAIAYLPRWHASLHWRALLHGYVVSDHRLEHPALQITRPQMKTEAQDETPLQDRRWQEALLAVYPFKVDVFTMIDADITYRDNPRSKPLHLDKLNIQAKNIRNVELSDRIYPSTIHVDGRVFDSGRITMDGAANFLAQPHLGVNVDVALEAIHLKDVVPITRRVNIQLSKGVLSTKGHIEYSPMIKEAMLHDLMLEGVHVDYVHSSPTKEAEKKVAATTVETAEQLSNHPQWLLRLDQAKILNSELGFVNEAATPPYRVYLTDANIGLDNFSNQLKEGTAYVKVTGKFMGSGLTQVSATFRPEIDSPDFDLQMTMVKTKMRSLNDVLRAYGDFDVVNGVFSFFTELTVKNGSIHGYVKPLFKDVNVYDPEQDQEKGLLHQLYEGVVGGTMTVLENRPRGEVATKAELSGPAKRPRMSTWQLIAKLVQNAFFKAILPGLERESKNR